MINSTIFTAMVTCSLFASGGSPVVDESALSASLFLSASDDQEEKTRSINCEPTAERFFDFSKLGPPKRRPPMERERVVWEYRSNDVLVFNAHGDKGLSFVDWSHFCEFEFEDAVGIYAFAIYDIISRHSIVFVYRPGTVGCECQVGSGIWAWLLRHERPDEESVQADWVHMLAGGGSQSAFPLSGSVKVEHEDERLSKLTINDRLLTLQAVPVWDVVVANRLEWLRQDISRLERELEQNPGRELARATLNSRLAEVTALEQALSEELSEAWLSAGEVTGYWRRERPVFDIDLP